MVSRCANPSCNARFKYLHEGRLFQFASAGTPSSLGQGRLNLAFWWLCSRCSSTMTLIHNEPTGAKLVLLSKGSKGSLDGFRRQIGGAA